VVSSVLEVMNSGEGDILNVDRWFTPVNVEVIRTTETAGAAAGVRASLENVLEGRRGLLMFQDHERAIGYMDPPVEVVARGDRLTVRALNQRGAVLLPALRKAVEGLGEFELHGDRELSGCVAPTTELFAEEDRTRHAGLLRAVRALVNGMAAPTDPLLGLYGAFGYDLIFQMDPIELRQTRDPEDRDLVLHLPDEIIELDLVRDEAVRHRYEFVVEGCGTALFPGTTETRPFTPSMPGALRDHAAGEYAEVVTRALPRFRAGDLFEVVPSQVFHRACTRGPAELFRRLRETNPAPYSLLANLGEGEYLVGASPEMYVRVDREADDTDRLVVRTAPISGTAARGGDALEDAENIRELLNSVKDESELTMCTDVDRNDKSRVCVPGSIRVTGRRKIELYSALIHTVDQVEGVLRPDCDALDAFLSHLWAVTVTGAPKLAAVEFIERYERSPRRWYGGSVGRVGFNGTLDTVLTLRTIQVRDGVATVRAGATLLCNSIPSAEEAETELKAKALLRVLDEPRSMVATGAGVAPIKSSTVGWSTGSPADEKVGDGTKILLVDHRDSFVHCLGDCFRQTGARVVTYRFGDHLPMFERERPNLIVLSPGPGRPADFELTTTIKEAERLGIPIFGVCLGLQGLIEYFGGNLDVLSCPVHGRRSPVTVTDRDSRLLAGLPSEFDVGRYHSLYAAPDSIPHELKIVGTTRDGVVMAVEHRTRPIAAVQFHPESIMTSNGGAGRQVIENVVAWLARKPAAGVR
jgi:anthranilate synthase